MNHLAQPSAVVAAVPSRSALSRALLAIAPMVMVAGAIGSLSLPVHAAGPSATALYKHGQAAEASQDYDTAFEDYQKAFQRNPKDLRYQTALYRVRVSASSLHISNGRKMLEAGNTEGALAEFLHASEIDPGNEAAQQEIARVRQRQGQAPPSSEISLPEPPGEQEAIDSIGAPAQLKPVSNEHQTLHMTEDTKVVYQAIGKAAGINVLFDPDFTSKRIQVDLNDVTLPDALRIVGTMSNTFWRPITSNSIFVAQNTRTKRTELDEQAVQTFYLTNAWQQNDLNDVQTALRNVMPNVKAYAVQSQNAIVMRGTPDELLLGQKLISDLDKPRPEVVVDMAILEVSKNWQRTLGIAWPSSFGIALEAPGSTSSTGTNTTSTSTSSTTSPTLYDLSHLKASDFAVTVGSATLNLLLSDTSTQILQDPRVRATDGQKASMKIGSKIPIATGSYQTGAATALVSSLVNTQFQYEDVGVDIEMTPSVHYDHDVTLKIKITVSAQSGSVTISGVTEPILSQRVVDQVIRLREGEASILGGIQDNQETQSWTGVPGLSSIPILKYLFGSKDHTIQKDEIVFVVVPHVVRGADINSQNLRAIDTGTGQSIDLRHVGNSVAAGAPAVLPIAANTTHSTFGTVPGQSADAAAPAALAQMSASMQPSFAQPPPMHQAPPSQAAPAAQPGAPSTQPQPQAAPSTVPPGPGAASFVLNIPPSPVATGSTFQVPVVLAGGTDVSSIPLQLHFDQTKLSLVNVSQGSFLNRDGQAAAVIHRDDGAGNLTVVTSRPPGVAGLSGGGVVCILTFQARAAGESAVAITQASTVNSTQQQVLAQGASANIVVR